jgi:hypothetical protein
MISILLFICLVAYYIYRAKYIYDIEFYILVLLFSFILFLRYTKVEKFTIKDNVEKYIKEKEIKTKINNIKNIFKRNINTMQINKLFSLIKQKLNGYKI